MEQWSTTIQSAFDLFYLEAQSRRYTASTLAFYQRRLGPFIRWCHAQDVCHLKQLTPSHIRLYLVALQKRNLASHSQHAAARAIKTFLRFCVEEGLLEASPMSKVKMPRLEKKILEAFTADDIKKLLAACESEREKAIVFCLLDTGARAHEFINLTGGDIDVQTGIVFIEKGKGQKERITYLGAKARKQLLRYYMRRGVPGAKEPVWLSEKRQGVALGQSGLMQLVRELGQRAGVSPCTCHTFRRTFALTCLRNGMNVYVLAKLMGHSDISVLRQYLALVEDDLRAAHQKYGPADKLL